RRESNGPRRSARGVVRIGVRSAAAADLQDLAAALRAGALERRLAILHGDPLRVLDFDLHLVLDAVSLGHGEGSSSVQRGVTGTLVPCPQITISSRETAASGPSRRLVSAGPSSRGSGAPRAPSPRTPP